MQPISPPAYNCNPVAASTPISTSNEQSLREEKEEDPNGKRNGWVSARTHRSVSMWKENIQGIESGKSRIIYAKIKAESILWQPRKLPYKLERD